jgi:hypothetical protein
MKTEPLAALAAVFSLGLVIAEADSIKLNDGTVIEGTLGAPTEVTIRTPSGDKRIAFSQLPAVVQKTYWAKATVAAGTPVPAVAATAAAVADDEIAALANDVNLETWATVASIGSFRDKPEKRGPGGIVVAKAFNAIEENWATVYSPKDPIGMAGDWTEQTARARTLIERNPQFMQRRWLDLFVKAGEAVSRRDSNEFASAVRELKRERLSVSAATGLPTASATMAPENFRNIFPAK